MLSESKKVGGIQEQDNNLDDFNWKEMMGMLSEVGPVQLPDTQPTVDHSFPGSSNDMYTSARRLQLRFSTAISSPVLTGEKIKGENCETIKVVLIDGHTGKHVDSGPEAFAEVEIVVLKKEFASVRTDDWTSEEFDKNIVKVWKHKKSLLAETKKLKPKLKLKEGYGVLDEICFTNNRIWQGKTKFRLGARIVDDLNRGRVREAKTEPFELKDCRLKSNSKHSSPSLLDKVWRLNKIDRKGNRLKRLREANINTVEDFLILWFLNPQKLCEIYGGGGKNWDDTVSHALTCPDKMVCYPSSSREQTAVVVNASAEVPRLLSDRKFLHIDNLSDANKANAQKSVISAFECPENVDCFDLAKELTPNSPNVSDFPSGHDFWTKEITDHCYDQMQPSTSTHDTFPSHSVDFYSPQTSNLEEVVSNNLMDDEALFRLCSSFDDDIHDAIFHESYGSELLNANRLNYTNESTLVQACAGPFDRAQRRWKIFSKVWSGAWYFIKKKAAESFHAKKKLRLC